MCSLGHSRKVEFVRLVWIVMPGPKLQAVEVSCHVDLQILFDHEPPEALGPGASDLWFPATTGAERYMLHPQHPQ